MENNKTLVLPELIPGFDCVEWKREVHAKFQRETEGMTEDEVREYYRRGAERFDKERAEYRSKHGLD
ncbi:MAG: hypothetical protein FWE67_09490 [Planctomycetaceae bacterium]|nr:hypothetical protein [Planctomycetaceae bacterium]